MREAVVQKAVAEVLREAVEREATLTAFEIVLDDVHGAVVRETLAGVLNAGVLEAVKRARAALERGELQDAAGKAAGEAVAVAVTEQLRRAELEAEQRAEQQRRLAEQQVDLSANLHFLLTDASYAELGAEHASLTPLPRGGHRGGHRG